MENKSEKTIQDKDLTAQLLIEKLSGFAGVTSKKMFGGYGIFKDGKMFGMVDSKGNCFLKTSDTTRPDFEKEGSVKHSRMPYFTIPEKVFNDLDTLLVWAEKSMNA